MANERKYYWLKLKRDFFKRHNIRIIEEMPNGKEYVLFYLKMLVESIDHDGELRFNETIPYNEQMLSVITNTNIDIVRHAMKLFIELKMIDLFDDETIYMSEVQKMIGNETEGAERVRKHRAKQGMAEIKFLPAPVTKTNAERQRSFRAKKSCEEKQHVPFIEDYMNNGRYGGNYYIVMKRDKFKCVICNSIEKLCVHHIDGYDENKHDNNSENKMVTLCRTCHSQTHAGAKIPEDVLDSIDYYTVTESCNADVTKCNTEIELEKEIDTESDKDTTADKSAAFDLLCKAFDSFWSAYPNKKAKPAALKAFTKLKPDAALLAEMLKAIEQQKQSPQWRKDGGQYIPMPSTWLNQKRWEDDYGLSGTDQQPKSKYSHLSDAF